MRSVSSLPFALLVACATADGNSLPATLVAVELTPATVTLGSGATQQFSVVGRRSDGSTQSVSVSYTATGGTVTSGGLYTAGSTAGSFRVIATQQSGTLADTAAVTITAAPPPSTVDTVLRQNFETLPPLSQVFQDVFYTGGDGATLVTNAALAAEGSRYLESTYSPGGSGSGGALTIFLDGVGGRPSPLPNVRMEWSAYLPPTWQAGTRFSSIRGSNARVGSPYDAVGVAGLCPQTRPDSRAFFVAETNAGEYGGNPGQVRFYTQFPGMGTQGGFCYGQGGQTSGPWDYSRQRDFTIGSWHRLVHEVQLNDVGQANGWQRIWLDGQLVAEWTALTFRTTADVLITVVQLEPFTSTAVPAPSFQRIDDLVVTTRR